MNKAKFDFFMGMKKDQTEVVLDLICAVHQRSLVLIRTSLLLLVVLDKSGATVHSDVTAHFQAEGTPSSAASDDAVSGSAHRLVGPSARHQQMTAEDRRQAPWQGPSRGHLLFFATEKKKCWKPVLPAAGHDRLNVRFFPSRLHFFLFLLSSLLGITTLAVCFPRRFLLVICSLLSRDVVIIISA
jgi:hypothetical protein